METPEVRTAMRAVIKSTPSKVMTKENGGEYTLMAAEILDGKGKGLVVLATRTIKNAKGETKENVNVGDEVTLYHSTVPSTKAGEKNAHFFEISTAMETASNTVLDNIFAN